MKTKLFKLLIIITLITTNSCKNSTSVDYKYTDNPKALTCEIENSKLLNEAIHAFENDVLAFYDKTGKNKYRAFSAFLNELSGNKVKYKDVASKHTLALALALKEEASLWSTNQSTTTLNYSHPILDCIANNIKNTQLKTTFNALLATNSMRKNVVIPAIKSFANNISTDGNIVSFLALEYYIPNVWSLTPEDLKNPEENKTEVDFNKTPKPAPQIKQTTPAKTKEDEHAGHNH